MKNIKKENKKMGFNLVEVIVMVIITGVLCCLATGYILYKHYEDSTIASYDKLSKNEHINEFLKVYSSIIDEYYEDVNESELIDSAINAMFDYLGDAYSEHLTQEQTDTLMEKLAGEYVGIGVEIYDNHVIYSVFDDSPAAKAGILANDIITKINDEDVSTKSNGEIASLIKSVDTEFNITILRNDEEKTFSVKKDSLYIPSVNKKVIEENNKKIGYIQISSFSTTTSKQFKEALKKIEEQNIDSLIIDVRNNSGGYLISAKEIASLFLEKGKVIYSLEEKKNTKKYKDSTLEKRDYKVVVLINQYSASASEILAAALKDSYGAILVGQTSYGKGKVQQTMNLEDGSMAKYTTAKWLTPSGTCIDGVGLEPDYKLELQLNEDETQIIDTQFNKALEVLGS